MKRVGAFHAKTHFSSLLARAAKGERILITNRGKPSAMLVPVESAPAPNAVAAVREMLAERDRDGPVLGPGLTIRDLINEGRR